MKKEEEKEFESLLTIDKTRLDDECENQPYLVWDYGRMTAKAIKLLDEAKADMKVAEAEVDISIRENPADYDLDADKKPTETAIKGAVLRSKEYQSANKKCIEAQYRLNMLEAANKALDHRRTSLTMLNGQDERNYFSRPAQKERSETAKDFRSKKKRRS